VVRRNGFAGVAGVRVADAAGWSGNGAVIGLGGSIRNSPDSAERARTAVSDAIRRALAGVERVDVDLAGWWSIEQYVVVVLAASLVGARTAGADGDPCGSLCGVSLRSRGRPDQHTHREGEQPDTGEQAVYRPRVAVVSHRSLSPSARWSIAYPLDTAGHPATIRAIGRDVRSRIGRTSMERHGNDVRWTELTAHREANPMKAFGHFYRTTLIALSIIAALALGAVGAAATAQAIVVRPCGGEQCGENHNQVLVV
jgi:hypothetical protein